MYYWVRIKGKKTIARISGNFVTILGSCKFFTEADVEEFIEQIEEPYRKENDESIDYWRRWLHWLSLSR